MAKFIRVRKFIKAIEGHRYELEYQIIDAETKQVTNTWRESVPLAKTGIRAHNPKKQAEVNEQGSWLIHEEA